MEFGSYIVKLHKKEGLKDGGEWRIRTTEGKSQQIYSLPLLAA